jgi:hypothetical protein
MKGVFCLLTCLGSLLGLLAGMTGVLIAGFHHFLEVFVASACGPTWGICCGRGCLSTCLESLLRMLVDHLGVKVVGACQLA